MPSSFVFSGHTAYLEAAAEDLGRPGFARAASRQVALTALANLCAQASQAVPADVPSILARASEFRDQLAIAVRAADAMIADVETAAWFTPEPTPAVVEPERTPSEPANVGTAQQPPPARRRKRGRS